MRLPQINSYLEFRRDMLPRIRALGYNTIQIMAIQEHAYYGSFGYHVTNFFAVPARCAGLQAMWASWCCPHGLHASVGTAHSLCKAASQM